MNKFFLIITATVLCGGGFSCKPPQSSGTKQSPAVWVTDASHNVLFQRSELPLTAGTDTAGLPVITVNSKQRFQEMDGFGCTLTGGSAQVIHRMGAAERAALLKELFDTAQNGVGISYLRISIGASDLDEKVFSYDDMPDGQTDPTLAHFSLEPDRAFLLPVLKEILAINPRIKILGSPWSAPVWMKDKADAKGGSLKAEYQQVYAAYLTRYIHEMQQEGVTVDAITVQNEPLHPGNNPSMLMLAPQQADFVAKDLGPAFSKAGIKTKIIIYDHNADKPEYPISILDNPEARKYVDGSAFHLYGGKIEALSKVHNAYPDKNLYFTEQWLGAPGHLGKDLAEHIHNLTIGASRNWCKTVLEWNLASDPEYKPHTDRGGCDRCLGVITVDGNRFLRNPAWYILAHSARFVRPGSHRIDSNEPEGLSNVAFETADGKKVLIVLNTTKQKQAFRVLEGRMQTVATLEAGAVATYVW